MSRRLTRQWGERCLAASTAEQASVPRRADRPGEVSSLGLTSPVTAGGALTVDLRDWRMRSEIGLRRLVNFSDAVVAIAITLLILPLVDEARTIGTTGVTHFVRVHSTGLVGFLLSFAVIGSFWWGQHHLFEQVRSYNKVLVGAMFVWLLTIVFLPFPTELLQSAQRGLPTAHAIYIGTMLVTAVAALAQEWAVVRWPELREPSAEPQTLDEAVLLAVMMGAALVITVVAPGTGLWGLVLLLLVRPLRRLTARRRRRAAESTANSPPGGDVD